MNQMYADIAEKDQILNDDIKLEIDKQQEHQNIVQVESETQSKNKNCDFCNHLGYLKEIKTIKKIYFLCHNCSQSIRTYEQNQLHIDDSKLMKNIVINVPQELIPYDLEIGQCRRCDRQNQILFMIGYCNHYFCHRCLSLVISYNLSHKKYQMYCPKCDSLIDGYCQFYILYKTQSIDHLIKPKMCCINKNCVLTILSEPYKEFKATSLEIDNDKAICNFCSKQFCALCWNSHKGACNYEKNFKDSFKKLGIVKCPRCNSPGKFKLCRNKVWSLYVGILFSQVQAQDKDYVQHICQDQFCPLCGYRFCLKCLGPVQIYDSVKNKSGYTCYKCKRNIYN